MKCIEIKVSAQWGHFKIPETNNSPLTFSFIHKVAALGLIGAVNGIQRPDMSKIYPMLCNNILYGVKILKPVCVETHSFSRIKVGSVQRDGIRTASYLKNPSYILTFAPQNEETTQIIEDFKNHVIKEKAVFRPFLGNVNCPCSELEFIEEHEIVLKNNNFETTYVIPFEKWGPLAHRINSRSFCDYLLTEENMPTFQDEHRFNPQNQYKSFVYCNSFRKNGNDILPCLINADGEHYQKKNGETICLF
jgi:CRISPR-associated protein Cas5 subtype I-B